MSGGHSAGVPGIAVAMIGAGSLLVYSGIRNVPMLDVLRSVVRGQKPPPGPGAVTSPTDPAAPPGASPKLPPGVTLRPGANPARSG